MKQRSLSMRAIATGALLLESMLFLTGCDQDSSPPPEMNTGTQVAVAEHTTLGKYLADGKTRSLYLFTDGEGNPVSCTDQCAEIWPPFLAEGTPDAGDEVEASLLNTTRRPDGTTQVVYNGWPLYYFANDTSPGDVNGEGIESFGGKWYLVSPAGEKVEEDTGGSDDDDGDDGGGPGY